LPCSWRCRRYGFDRDELYFLDGARHLQASYVDQPALAPLLAGVSLKLFGVSLPGLRVWPALAAWATVVVGGLIAREFGGGKRAQLLAALGTATMPVLLGAAHVANTTAYELLAWAGLALVVARIGRTGECRWWLAGGLVAGLGVADDHSMSFFAIALVIGALLSGGRRMIWNRWFLAGAAIAVAFEVPDLPATDIAWTYKTNPTLGETVGWPQFVRTVNGVWKSLPPRQRASTVIFTADYGEAGAINELGRGTGLPTAVSGQNSEWWWGQETRTRPPCWPSRPDPSMSPATPLTSGSSSPTCGWQPRCRIPTASTIRNGAATSTCAPAPATRGPSYGHGYATTTDPQAAFARHHRGDRSQTGCPAARRKSSQSCGAVTGC
jgi:hypothetical protein